MAKDYDDELDLEETGGFGKEAVAEAAKRDKYSPSNTSTSSTPTAASKEAPKKQSFGEAFSAARKSGDKTFMFGGKKYTTEMKGEAKKPAATSKTETAKAEPAKAEPAKAEPAKAAASNRMTPKEKLQNLRIPSPEVKKPDIKPDSAPEKGSPLDKARKLVRGVRIGPARQEYKSGGSVKSSASKRADGCAVRGKTKGKMV